jgi:hypothetical protein
MMKNEIYLMMSWIWISKGLDVLVLGEHLMVVVDDHQSLVKKD